MTTILLALALAGLFVLACLLVFVYALIRAADELDPLEPPSVCDTLTRLGDEVETAVILDFRPPHRRSGGGWVL